MTVAHVQVHIEGDPRWPVARLDGEVDLSNVDGVAGALEAAVSNAAFGLVLDLTGVSYLDSTGLRLLFRLARRLRDRQQALRLVVPVGALIWRVLELSGVPDVVPVSRSRAKALLATSTPSPA